jgi:hypothetical protein
MEEINLVLERARQEIRKVDVPQNAQSYKDIVLILDNLEKIRKIEGVDEGHKSHYDLFLDRYTQLTGMKAHVIYTVPLRLVRSPEGPQLEMHYSMPLVLPMIKVIEHRTGHAHADGLKFLRQLLQQRLEDIPLEEVFEAEALEFLLKYSGGHIRNLMIFVRNACTYTNTIPIKLPAVHQAVHQSVRTYSTAVPEHHWSKLAQLDYAADQQLINGDEDYLQMLENLSILEYMNDCRSNDPFNPGVPWSAAPWYAVNPIVKELTKFKSAKETIQRVVTNET